jgi:hypothetical protein
VFATKKWCFYIFITTKEFFKPFYYLTSFLIKSRNNLVFSPPFLKGEARRARDFLLFYFQIYKNTPTSTFSFARGELEKMFIFSHQI